ncbi:MAG: 23S rRNA (uracil(1939)-C(5))-methyltransferase RlmD [Lachnospiraceae bacterium]|nr:23S rRNA (uracil(1939)-C(5))-methyltransferase RlmD [Lachnospiraceae bacterium]
MKKGEKYIGICEEIKFPNQGVIRQITSFDGEEMAEEGAYAIVKNALPGQKVAFLCNKKRSGKAEGRLLEVLCKAAVECDERCVHSGICGGCLYQGFPYEEQLSVKENQVKRLLAPFTETAVFDGIFGSPLTSGYRNKMELSFGDEVKDGDLTLGLHRRNSTYDLSAVEDCQIMDADYNAIVAYTQTYFRTEGLSFFHKLTHIGYLRHLLVRKARFTGEILVAIVTTTQQSFDLTDWKEGLLQLSLTGRIAGILHMENDAVSDVVRADQTHVLYGKPEITEKLLGLSFKISPFSFFQTNSAGAEVLYSKVRDYVGDDGNDGIVYDLYSGTGTIAQILAPAAKKVIGVEIVEEAVEAAKENADLNGLTNCHFIAGDVFAVLDSIEEKPDYIILDPPRDGIHPKALPKIIAYQVPSIVYISCKPTSLERDLPMFLAHGYTVKRYCMVDMFPYTGNVESIVLLSRKIYRPEKDYIKVGIDAEDYYAIKNSEKE